MMALARGPEICCAPNRQEAMPFSVTDWGAANTDAHLHYQGNSPTSWRASAESQAQLIALLGTANPNDAAAIKEVLFTIIANTDCLISGSVAAADIDGAEWFAMVGNSTRSYLAALPNELHATAVERKENRNLNVRMPSKTPDQSKLVPYLTTGFRKMVGTAA
jgi:hypothetical protein